MPGKPKGARLDRALIAHLPEAAVITAGGWANNGADILFVNAAFCALTGYTAAGIEGKNIRLLHGPRTDLAGLHRTQPGRSSDGGSEEGWLYRKSGVEFFARWNFRPINRRANGPLIVVFHDHTEFWRQREALLQSQKLDTLGLLAGGVAHDFNNLISLINGYCQMLVPKVAGQLEVEREVKEIHRAGLKAAAVTRQILEFSRRQATAPAVVNFNTLIREVAEIIRRACGDTIALELRLASDLGNARINPTHFQQVLLNLCFNAREAMPEGGHLLIRTYNHFIPTSLKDSRPGLGAGSHVAMEVIDQGTGIAPAVRPHIFEPFYTTKPHGTGLGLATARGLIRQAHGHIAVRSTSPQGTCFEVILPETAEAEQPTLATLDRLPATAGTEAILLIEPEETLRRMIAGILATDGYSVTEAATPREAARRGASPQLVIVDAGSEASRQLVADLLKVNPALRLIGVGDRLPDLPGLAPTAVAHLPKPFALSTLLQQIRGLLDGVAK
jgi:two-component system cell cycle sensor histidine kinase/response regulator CckA